MTNTQLVRYLHGTCPSSTGLVLLVDGTDYPMPPGGALTMELHPESSTVPEVTGEMVDVISVGDARAYWCDPAVCWLEYSVNRD